jgi:hypothetical protein
VYVADSSAATWRKSSYSSENGACVELVGTLDLVRDSKNPAGPVVAADLLALLAAIRIGRFDS